MSIDLAVPENYLGTTRLEPVRDFERVREGLYRSCEYLRSLQSPEGYWVGELEGDTILESESVLLWHFLGWRDDPRIAKAARTIARHVLPGGGWSLYPGGDPDLSSSIKAYLALKLAGWPLDDPIMVKSRETILALGGLDRANSFTRIYLAIFGLYDWDKVPSVPPEICLFPLSFPFNIYQISSWSRAILVPLSIIYVKRPHCALPVDLDELRIPGTEPSCGDGTLWSKFFLFTDRLLKIYDRAGFSSLRERAMTVAEKWTLRRLERSGGLGAIFPAMVNSVFALMSLGYSQDSPEIAETLRELERFELDDERGFRIQPCVSPVWDTAQALKALLDAGVPPYDADLQRAGEWLLSKQSDAPGDWKFRNPELEAGGWYFEFENEHYPDVDDTAMVLNVLSSLDLDPQSKRQSIRRGLNWLYGMECQGGGWASFDKDVDQMVFSKIPFADHNAMLDPPTVDITARVLEMLGHYGVGPDNPMVERSIRFVLKNQEPDGSWFGRWGVNYVYGTWQALVGLKAVGADMNCDSCLQAGIWLRSCQNRDGGWGESCRSYEDSAYKAQGPSTASQTAWALMGLFATGDYSSMAVRRGVEYLLETQNADGGWDEESFTGTGFPKVFYLRYHLYRLYFPIRALGLYHQYWKA